MSLTLYYFRHCPSCKTVMTTLDLLGVQAKLVHIDVFKKEQLQDWFLKLNPAHTVPVLIDEDLTITESRPILTYLVNQYGDNSPLYPVNDAKTKARIDNWLYFDHGTLTPAQRKLYLPVIQKQQLPGPEIVEEYEQVLDRLETHLASSDHFVGSNLTLADMAIYSTLGQAQIPSYKFTKFPNVLKWQERIRSELAGEKEIFAEPMAELVAEFQSKLTEK